MPPMIAVARRSTRILLPFFFHLLMLFSPVILIPEAPQSLLQICRYLPTWACQKIVFDIFRHVHSIRSVEIKKDLTVMLLIPFFTQKGM
jgi:hypothetical protein